ncbi:CAMK/CAMKL protein kinase, partial [Sphaeroforma arctica JP610]
VDEYRAEQKIEEQKEHQTGTFSSTLSREVRLLQSLEHPNIIRLYQVVETEYEYYIITEFAPGGEIIDYIAKKEHLTEKEARRFFRELVSAIDHCHLSGVLHRDLKLENILLSAEKHVLVTDFGLGRSYQAENLCGTFCGTPLYAAPELVSGTKYFGPPADIWAMGVVLYAMVVGKPPFQADNMSELYRRIKNVEFKFPEWCSPEFRDVIGRIFTKDTNERITMDELRTHTWVVGEYGNPPLRLQPEKAIVELNSRDAKACYM